jgi:hypothetical protein
MGQSWSTSSLPCVPYAVLPKDEFQISMDLEAFDMQFLRQVKSLQVATLTLAGSWSPHASEYEDDNVRVSRDGIDVKQPIEFLYLAHKAIKRNICTMPTARFPRPIIYVSIIFKKQPLGPGHYKVDENFVLLSNDRLVIANKHQESRPTMAKLVESDFDMTLLSFMAHDPV